jgi:hypothetical protein
MDQKPEGIPAEITGEVTKEMNKAPIGEGPLPDELQPVVDTSEPVPSASPVKNPVKMRRAWYYWTS